MFGLEIAATQFPDLRQDGPSKDLFLFGKGVGRNVPVMFQRLSSDWLGAPLLPALALLGALRRPWRGLQASSRLFVMLVAAVPVVANTIALQPGLPRYSFVFVPLLSIWAANGLFAVGLWARASSAAAGWILLARPIVSQYIVPGLIGLAMIISPAKGVRRLYKFSESALPSRVEKEVGLWIRRQQNVRARIMDTQMPLAYHAGAQFSHFPYCTGELALRYLDAAQVDYISSASRRGIYQVLRGVAEGGYPGPPGGTSARAFGQRREIRGIPVAPAWISVFRNDSYWAGCIGTIKCSSAPLDAKGIGGIDLIGCRRDLLSGRPIEGTPVRTAAEPIAEPVIVCDLSWRDNPIPTFTGMNDAEFLLRHVLAFDSAR
jgi:hypothetical protein